MLLDLFFPRACLLCLAITKRPSHLCDACENELPILPEGCEKCADIACVRCQYQPPPFDRTFAAYAYEGHLPRLITALKFKAALTHTRLFSECLLTRLSRDWYRHRPFPTRLIPLPLHPKRLKERGFNQVLEIAKPLARALPIPLDTTSLIRQKNTAPQSGLSPPERAINIAHAFATTTLLTGEHVALLDDVMTTGQTLAAAALTLKAGGAATVDLWCLARATRTKVAEMANNR